VASKRDRLRKLERAKAERRIARQAAAQRRKRQVQAGIGASLALVLIVVGTIWLLGGFDPEPRPTIASGDCTWKLLDPATDPAIVDTGHPPTTLERREGTETMTIQTTLGEITAELDLAKAPCTALSFKYLAEKKFFDGTTCHRLSTTDNLLQCGAPDPTGAGGPSYQFDSENVPEGPNAAGSPSASPTASPTGSATASPSAAPRDYYPKGTIALANAGAGTNSSHFYIFYNDSSTLGPAYSIAGHVTKGLEIVETLARGGAIDSTGADVADGKPKTPIVIQTLLVGPPPAPPTPTPTSGGTGSPTPATPASPTSSPTP
jgi:peptidyl-prolyl cis-trans isomerase B (cyclophilin B)